MPRGPKPKPPGQAVTRHEKTHQFLEAPAVGWQHGEIPAPPDGLLPKSVEAWESWFAGWWAAFWCPADLPGLRMVVEQLDGLHRGSVRVTAVTPLLDRYGITPKGRQDLRWQPPKVVEPVAPSESRRAQLKVV